MNSPKENTLLSLDYAEITIPDIFSSHGKYRKHQEAVVCGSVRRTWGDFNDNMNRIANALLASGVSRGDRVVVMMGNSVEILEVMLTLLKDCVPFKIHFYTSITTIDTLYMVKRKVG